MIEELRRDAELSLEYAFQEARNDYIETISPLAKKTSTLGIESNPIIHTRNYETNVDISIVYCIST